ncbi:MAG: glycyl-radical enzyme activating protein [Synergistaceae bacterium]|nr:glycyl-radical enzyme activating protein [Synergistaceae bacterium]
MKKTAREAVILRVERLSPNDGPGLRTVIFFKGCPLRCAWCSTPESQNAYRELYYKKNRCLGCGRCVSACPSKALSPASGAKKIMRDQSLCDECLVCAGVCPAGALGVYGEKMTVSDVMALIRRDEIFYFHSSGGVTLSGGDALCYPDFARELLMSCKESGIHTMAELSVSRDYWRASMLIPFLDAYYVDIKLMNPENHLKWTGADNRDILANIRSVSREWPKRGLHARVPLIPGVNDSKSSVSETALFCKDLTNCRELEFLPYHRLGISTYRYLGRETPFAETPAMTFEEALGKVEFLAEMKPPFPVKIAGQTVWTPNQPICGDAV